MTYTFAELMPAVRHNVILAEQKYMKECIEAGAPYVAWVEDLWEALEEFCTYYNVECVDAPDLHTATYDMELVSVGTTTELQGSELAHWIEFMHDMDEPTFENDYTAQICEPLAQFCLAPGDNVTYEDLLRRCLAKYSEMLRESMRYNTEYDMVEEHLRYNQGTYTKDGTEV